MTTTTTPLETSASMVVVGVGLGLVLQVLVIAVQNALPSRHLGTVTSAVASTSSGVEAVLRGALADAITWVFLLVVPVVLIAFVLSWLLHEPPLRTTIHVASSLAEAPPTVRGFAPTIAD